jgi:hypothetical protein
VTALIDAYAQRMEMNAKLESLESARRRLAIRVVYALSAAGLLAVVINWIAG